ncbi:hypothetical protein, partial [Amycolatopsis speibonae]
MKQTGMGVPAPLVFALSGGEISRKQAHDFTYDYKRDHGTSLYGLKRVRSLVPEWLTDFRPGEGEWEQFGDVLAFLKANKEKLPVNIWLEPSGKTRGQKPLYSEPLQKWVEVWMRAYKEARAQADKRVLTPEELVPLVGGIAQYTTVQDWNRDSSWSFADLSLDDAPSGEGEGSGQPPAADLDDVALVAWRPGPRKGVSLEAYLKAKGRLSEATPDKVREWGIGIQRDAVKKTGLGVPALLMVTLSGGRITMGQARGITSAYGPSASDLKKVRSLVPKWLTDFRPGEGEWLQFDDVLSLLKANRHRLPVNISLEPKGQQQYPDLLLRWVEVWLRAYQEARAQANRPVLEPEELARLTGIVHSETVLLWNSDSSWSFADLSLDNAPSGSGFPGPSGGSGVGASTTSQGKRRRSASPTPQRTRPRPEAPEASGSQLLRPGLEVPEGAGRRPGAEHETLGLPGSGSGVWAGAPSFSAAGMPVPVVPGAGGGGWVWPVGSELQQVEMQGLARELQEEMSQRLEQEAQIQLGQEEMQGVSREFREEMSQWLGREEQIQPADVGVIIGGVGSVFRDAAALLLKEAGVHGVVLLDEGAPDLGVIVRGVLDSGWVVGEAIRLFACEVGDGVLAGLAVALS